MSEAINNILERGVEEIIDRKHLENALKSGKKLRIKYGIDPTGEKIHLGRAGALWKLKEFQGLGHKIILIIGDFTAQIGDPSDKLKKRPFLTPAEVKKNMEGYLPQIGKILNLKKTEVYYNSKWLSKLDFKKISELAELFSVQQMLERRNFKIRLDKQEEISLRELLYPIMQGFDSVEISSDVEIGGNDQLFNFLAGRKIQEHFGMPPQDILTLKMLLGTNGEKMSTSQGNVINISDSPEDQYGKTMSLKDDLIIDYFVLATDVPDSEIKKLSSGLKNKKINPRDAKRKLAWEIVKRYYGEKIANEVQENFVKTFTEKSPSIYQNLKLKNLKISTLDLAVATCIPKSKSEARRLIKDSSLKVNGKVKNEFSEILNLKSGDIIKIGKYHFFKVE